MKVQMAGALARFRGQRSAWVAYSTGKIGRAIWGCVAVLAAGGCEVSTLLDPSISGRWQRTPIILPIISNLDVIDEPTSEPAGLRPVQPEDLIVDDSEYEIGSGDLLTVSVFELMSPNTETLQTRRVDETGQIRLPVLGRVTVAGMTASALEENLARTIEDRGILRDPTVSVFVQENRRKTFSILGGSRTNSVGIYQIVRNDFRLLDALAMSGTGTTGRILYIYRNVGFDPEVVAPTPSVEPSAPELPPSSEPAPAQDPSKFIEELLQGLDRGGGSETAPTVELEGEAPPEVLDSTLNPGSSVGRWINVAGKWQRVESVVSDPQATNGQAVNVTQVVIEVPFSKLINGDMSYNVVVRAGDILRLPEPITGNVYVGGAVNRPGTYSIPGEKELTLRQVIFAAGGFSPLAHPDRVDLIRRMEGDMEAIVRVDLEGIFNGTAPDFYLKPTDTVNVGTSIVAAALAIVRSGLRISYGFGFVYDRNFADEVDDDDNNN